MPSRKDDTLVALLRGVNVGGRNRLSMREVAAVFEEAGGREVRTYLQSGNVLLRATAQVARRLPDLAARLIAERHGLKVPVIVRTAGELDAVAAGNPFLAEGADPDRLHVVFLAESPARRAVDSLDPARSPPDAFRVQGREIFLLLPGGVARSRLTNDYFDARLGVVGTSRNWRTVRRLRDLACGGMEPVPTD